MAAGLEGRTIADKLADPNRPTWEQYKKENEDKLDLVGAEVRNMVEYRAQLDKERERRLLTAKSQSQSRKDSAISDSGQIETFFFFNNKYHIFATAKFYNDDIIIYY